MKTLQELEAQIKNLQEEIEKMKGNKLPENGIEFFNIGQDGKKACYKWAGDNVDLYLFYTGNFYLTEQEAEKAEQKAQALMRIKKFIFENNISQEVDWSNYDTEKYFIVYDHKYKEIQHRAISYSTHFDKIGYFNSQEDVEKVIENCKEDLEIFNS